MKKLFSTLLLCLLFATGTFSQNNNLIVYSQDGYKFSLILNGVLQNPKPSTNVKVTGLNATNYQTKIILENKMPDVNANVYLMWGGNATSNTEYSYALTDVKGQLKLKLKSNEPIPMQAVADPQQATVVYTTMGAPGGNVSTTTTSSTVETSTNGPDGIVNVSINVPMDGSIHTNTNTNSNTTTTYSTTTTTTSGNGMNNTINNGNQNGYVLQGYSGVYGCPYPMGQADFESAKQSIAAKGFDESRLTIAKQIIGSNCMLCSQIKEVMKLMSFEESKLELAKFAWHHNLDKGNYYKLNDAFNFESSISDLNQYTQSH